MRKERLFPFNELLLTEGVLKTLGFGDYWGECGEFGSRSLKLGDDDEHHYSYRIYEMDELEDPGCGYVDPPMYSSRHYCTKDFDTIYFLHELFEDLVARCTPDKVLSFIELTKKSGVNMYPYIEAYLKWKGEKPQS